MPHAATAEVPHTTSTAEVSVTTTAEVPHSAATTATEMRTAAAATHPPAEMCPATAAHSTAARYS